MRRSARVAAAGALLVMLAMLPVLTAVCALSCDVAGRTTVAHASCHDSDDAGARLTADLPDPCGTHDRAAAEVATRTPREHGGEFTGQDAKAVLNPHVPPRLGLAAITPGNPRPAPSRPPLVLRV